MRRNPGEGTTRARLAPLLLMVLIAICAPVAAADRGSAPDLPAEIALDELLELVRARSPELAAVRAGIDVALARRVRAGAFPRPELSVGDLRHLDGENTIDGHSQEVFFEQPLPLGGRRSARLRNATLELQHADARIATVAAGLAREARERFTALLTHRHRLDVLARGRADLRRAEEIIAGRVEAGVKSRYDLLRIRMEIVEVESVMRRVETELDDAAARIGALVGAPDWRPRPKGVLRALGVDARDLRWDRVRDSIPALRAVDRARDIAEHGIDLARREALPVPVLGVGAIRTSEPYSWAGAVTLSIELPFADRPRYATDEARAIAVTARLEQSAAELEARSELERSLHLLAGRTADLAHFEREILRDLPELRAMSEEAYIEGQIGIVELLDAFTTHIDAQLSHAELVESVALAEIRALAAAGRADAPFAPRSGGED